MYRVYTPAGRDDCRHAMSRERQTVARADHAYKCERTFARGLYNTLLFFERATREYTGSVSCL
jgi:hypothetical protein